MNIFVTSSCPYESAKNLDDKRVVKMALESAQMLCTALNQYGGTTPYKSTHKNHPCNVWVRESRSNWDWLFVHALALCEEYKNRYGKVHKCLNVIQQLLNQRFLIPEGDLTPFPNCSIYKDEENIYKAYQMFLDDKWQKDKRVPTWYGEIK